MFIAVQCRSTTAQGGVDNNIGLRKLLREFGVGLGDIARHGGEEFVEEPSICRASARAFGAPSSSANSA